ncbi:hypothetical protein GCM10007928_49600 [Sulfitobacter porphyrae]|nr:hypothetical protein GCM10007928_49600 [Sulfitobacter porphyrae]
MQYSAPPPRNPSWWLTEALEAEGNPLPAPALSGEERADVVIVGGGFTGLWTALAIKGSDAGGGRILRSFGRIPLQLYPTRLSPPTTHWAVPLRLDKLIATSRSKLWVKHLRRTYRGNLT